jgi:hypothetical protein
VYSFVQANKIFASNLLSIPGESASETSFSAFLSSTSYLAHHAYRSTRASHYATLGFLTLRLFVEDPLLVKRICSTDSKITVRLCRQRPPHLPLIATSRIPATAILDICTDTLSHNLKKRIDVPLYSLSLGIILRILTHLDATKTRLSYHWTYIWGSFISLIRFLTQYATDLNYLPSINELCTTLASLTAFSLTRGDAFLPDPSCYDDLFYKLVESHDLLPRFLASYSSSSKAGVKDRFTRSVEALISISTHYHDLLSQQGGRRHQSSAAVQKVIKDGYETLDLREAGGEDFGRWDRFREAQWKGEVKRMVRTAVEDARVLALR